MAAFLQRNKMDEDKKEEEEDGMSTGQAYFPSKQQSYYGEEYGENKEDVGGAHHCVVGELIGLTSDLVDVEADGEYEGSHTEEDHCQRGSTEKSVMITAAMKVMSNWQQTLI